MRLFSSFRKINVNLIEDTFFYMTFTSNPTFTSQNNSFDFIITREQETVAMKLLIAISLLCNNLPLRAAIWKKKNIFNYKELFTQPFYFQTK